MAGDHTNQLTEQRAQLAYLLAALRDGNVQTRAHAAWALSDVEPATGSTIAALIEALAHNEGYVCSIIFDALHKIGRPAIPALIDVMGHDHGWVRSWATTILGTMPELPSEAIVALVRAMNDGEPRVQVEAAGAVAAIQSDTPSLIAVLAELLHDDDNHVRVRASYHLMCLRAKSAIPDLISALHDDDRTVRENSAEALGLIGPEASEAVAELTALLYDSHHQVRDNAAMAIKRIGAGCKETTGIPMANQIQYLIGDATAPVAAGNKIICHVCNDVGGWGKGFVLAISNRWPQPEEAYRVWHREKDQNDFELGFVQLVEVEKSLWVANMIGQHGLKRQGGKAPIRYDAVESCLEKLCVLATEKSASVHMPRIGCGLAGGSWDKIEPIIQRTLCKGGFAVFVYDLK